MTQLSSLTLIHNWVSARLYFDKRFKNYYADLCAIKNKLMRRKASRYAVVVTRSVEVGVSDSQMSVIKFISKKKSKTNRGAGSLRTRSHFPMKC